MAEKTDIDYSKCIFQCRLLKKQLIGSATQYVYMFQDQLIICNVSGSQNTYSEAYKQLPDKVIELQIDTRVIWIYNQTSTPYQITGFQMMKDQECIEYNGEEVVLYKLKDSFSQIILQAKFHDEYQVLQQIGKGNYARVYSIKHRVSGIQYAVQCFEKQGLEDIEKGRVFEGENTFYLVMELVEGCSLYDQIKKHAFKKFPDDQIKHILKMLLEGIEYCSEHNVMHRDLKPENILFSKKGKISILKIVDLGLAAFENEFPYIFPKCGTPGFVAPEVANLTDKQSGKKFNDVLKKNKLCEINLSGTMYEFISPDAKDLLIQLLEKDPMQRISATDAKKHPYFSEGKIKQRSSFEDLDMGVDEENPEIRQQQASMFTKPLRIPYVSRDPNNSSNENSQSTGRTGSFINNSLFQGSRPQQDSDALYYTVGSLDQQRMREKSLSNGTEENKTTPLKFKNQLLNEQSSDELKQKSPENSADLKFAIKEVREEDQDIEMHLKQLDLDVDEVMRQKQSSIVQNPGIKDQDQAANEAQKQSMAENQKKN